MRRSREVYCCEYVVCKIGFIVMHRRKTVPQLGPFFEESIAQIDPKNEIEEEYWL